MSRIQAGLVLSMFALGCGNTQTASTAVSTDDDTQAQLEILNGYDATSHLFDAVGALVFDLPDGTAVPFCTATLVSANTVLTAKHCYLLTPASQPTFFVLGRDARNPTQRIPVRTVLMERSETGPDVMGLGSDTTVGVLAWPVTDVKPLGVRKVTKRDLNRVVLAVGYGQRAVPDHIDDPPLPDSGGFKMVAPLRINAMGGDRYYKSVYGNFDAYFHDFVLSDNGQTPPDELPTQAQAQWDSMLLGADHELHATSAISSRQWATASGDSGGPLLEVSGGVATVVGVASGLVYMPYDHMPNPALTHGTTYMSIGDAAQRLVSAAHECLDVSQEGVCANDASLEYCVTQKHKAAVKTVDCASGQSCVESPEGASCAAPCVSDANCEALGLGGVCTGGTCSWNATAQCLSHVSEGTSACALCCFLTDDPESCLTACFTAPTERLNTRSAARTANGTSVRFK